MSNKKLPKTKTCPDCSGSGIDEMDATMYCPLCDGKKRVPYKTWAFVTKAWEKHGHYKERLGL